MDADVTRWLRRARMTSRIAGLAFAVALLFLVLSDQDFDTTTGRVVFYGGVIVNGAVVTYASLRESSLRREQRRLDREEYRRLVSNQPTH